MMIDITLKNKTEKETFQIKNNMGESICTGTMVCIKIIAFAEILKSNFLNL